MPLNIHLVVAKYKEDVNWVFRLGIPHTIYNKDNECKDNSFVNLPNIGREAHTYLYYLVNNYNNLQDYTFFSEGDCLSNRNPEDTVEDISKDIHNFKGIPRIKPMSVEVKEWNNPTKDNYYEVDKNVIDIYFRLFNKKIDHFTYHIGGQYIVPRSRIKFHSLYFYKHLYENISDKRSVGYCAWTLERLWPHIYDGKTKSVFE
jgi:hypothetical protein